MESLIRDARNGDRDACSELALWMYPILRKYFEARRVAATEIDELVQVTISEVFAKLARHAPSDPAAFEAWIRGFARMRLRAASNERRRQHARAAKLRDQPEVPQTSMGGRLAKSERWQLLTECMQQLPDNYRSAIEQYLEGGGHGLGLGGRWKLMRAKKKLRQLVEEARRTKLVLDS